MRILSKRIYIITLVELIVLCFFLLLEPSEKASQFFLGRSLYRWMLAAPAILFFVTGLIFYFRKHEKGWWGGTTTVEDGRLLQVFGEYKGSVLLVINIIFPLLIFLLGWLSYRYRVSHFFAHGLPWLIFFNLQIWQCSYWVTRDMSEKKEDFRLRKAFLDIPQFFKKLIFDKQQVSPEPVSSTREILYWLSVGILVCLFLFVGYFFIKFAGLNSDEGWYLYAARQVYQGQRPYQDFAFTQMPLLPYVYGIGLLVAPSIYTGRFVSLIISVLCLYVLFLTAKRYFAREAFIWLLLILITNSDSFYFNTIVKTYPLTFLFFLLSLYLWVSPLKAEIKYPLVIFILQLGFFTRLTFAFYALWFVIKIMWETWRMNNRTNVFGNILILNLPVLLAGLTFLHPDPDIPVWDVYTYNAGIHGFVFSLSTISEYVSHLFGYFYSLKIFWPILIPVVLAIISGLYYKSFAQRNVQSLSLVTFAVFVFLSIHFLGSGPMYEYYVPATNLLVTVIIFFLFSHSAVKSGINFLTLWTSRLALGIITIMLIYVGRFGSYNYEYYHGVPPVETIKEISAVVNQYFPDHPVFTLEALYVAVEAGREIYPGMSMAQFSVLDLPTAEVKKFHFINNEILQQTLASEDTKILILNEREVADLNDFIKDDYTSIFEIDNFGQKSIRAYVFIRNQ